MLRVPAVNRDTAYFLFLYTNPMDVSLYVLKCGLSAQQPRSAVNLQMRAQKRTWKLSHVASGDTLTQSTTPGSWLLTLRVTASLPFPGRVMWSLPHCFFTFPGRDDTTFQTGGEQSPALSSLCAVWSPAARGHSSVRKARKVLCFDL